jgi:hypothetical protein
MTRDDIIRMAKKAELQCYMNLTEHSLAIEDLEHFAKLVRSDYSNKHSEFWLKQIDKAVNGEREACAKVCDDIDAEYNGEDVLATWCAKAIRARGSV